MIYYSQHGEDCLLRHFFKKKASGFFLDIGAFDGKHLSNSYVFDSDGWDGVCVEPELQYFQRCEDIRNVKCIHAACVDDPNVDHVKFTIMNDGGLGSGIEVTEKRKNKGRFTYSTTKVAAVTLNQILDDCSTYDGSIDFLSVDVEGTEISVLQGLDFLKHRPRVLIVEANNKQKRKELDEYVIHSLGYLYAGSMSVNRFYVQTTEEVAALRSIDVQCNLKTTHPTQQSHTTDKNRTVRAKLKVE